MLLLTQRGRRTSGVVVMYFFMSGPGLSSLILFCIYSR